MPYPATDTIPAASTWSALADAVLEGHVPTPAEAASILDAPNVELLALLDAAYRIRHRHFGNTVQLYSLKNAKSGLCPEDCSYCSQSAVSDAPVEKYVMLNEEKLLEGAREAVEKQSKTYCIVASGRGPSGREVDHVAKTVRRIKDETGLHICCCLGILTEDQAAQLKDAGVDRINHNLNTSRAYHEQICTTHTFDDRLNTLKNARGAGLELCAGMIVGMGETTDDVIDVALSLRELRVESIPINFLIPIDGTPVPKTQHLDPQYCLKVLSLFRFTNPATEIRIAGGREVHLRTMQPLGLYPANSMFVSDYLTTKGQAADDDHRMIADLGFEVVVA